MAGTNSTIIKRSIEAYKKKVFDDVEITCVNFCHEICEKAIFYRTANPQAHNFTGNLLNSIVVCLYRQRKPVYACYAADKVPKAIRVKMSGPRKYFFKRDYDGAESHYEADVPTNKGWGAEDARKFFNSYSPQGGLLFEIVVAYPTEYAEYVEDVRATTGIYQTRLYTEQVGATFLQLPQTTGIFMGGFPF